MPGLTPQRLNRAVATVIAEAREAAGLSQRELSDRLDHGATYVHMLESGKLVVSIYELARIARALDLTLAELAARIERRL